MYHETEDSDINRSFNDKESNEMTLIKGNPDKLTTCSALSQFNQKQ